LEELYCQYGDRAEFLLVVVREAKHKIPGLEFMHEKTTDQEHRQRLVARAMNALNVTMPAVLDGVGAEVEKAYAAWPLRIVVVDPTSDIDLDVKFEPNGPPAADRLETWLAQRFGTVVH
jgi:hypothetical protein